MLLGSRSYSGSEAFFIKLVCGDNLARRAIKYSRRYALVSSEIVYNIFNV